jgi:hypothetical protein
LKFDNGVLVHLPRRSRGWSNMRSENDLAPVNPYESPREANERMPPRSNAGWVGPLLVASVGFFCSALVFGAVTVAEQDRWIQYPLVAILMLAGVICLTTSFGLHRGWRRRLRANATRNNTPASNQASLW